MEETARPRTRERVHDNPTNSLTPPDSAIVGRTRVLSHHPYCLRSGAPSKNECATKRAQNSGYSRSPEAVSLRIGSLDRRRRWWRFLSPLPDHVADAINVMRPRPPDRPRSYHFCKKVSGDGGLRGGVGRVPQCVCRGHTGPCKSAVWFSCPENVRNHQGRL